MVKAVVVTILLGLVGLPQACFAVVSLGINPVDGSSSLRFERTPIAGPQNKQEIHVRVTSTSGNRFQIYQRVLEPLLNERGDVLNLQAIETQTLANTNSYGTLFLQNTDHLSMNDQLVYSSSLNGNSDFFTIGYSLNQNLINAGGNFRGRLVFTVRGAGNDSEVAIDVFLKASPSSGMKISVKAAHRQSRIQVRDTDTSERTADYVRVSFSGNSGQEIKVYQELDSMPRNESDEEVGANVLQLVAEGNTDGLRVHGPSSLIATKSLIYSSNKEADDFILYFLTNAAQVQGQNAGNYIGKIKYVVETGAGNQEFPIDFNFTVGPVFSVKVDLPPGGLNFTRVLPNTPPQDKEINVTVYSNLHKPYQVLQNLQTTMTNKLGKEFDKKYITIQVIIPKGQRGQTNFSEFTPIQTGEYPIFSSDSRGVGSAFTVVYRLQGYPQMNPGDFSTQVRFSLNQK